MEWKCKPGRCEFKKYYKFHLQRCNFVGVVPFPLLRNQSDQLLTNEVFQIIDFKDKVIDITCPLCRKAFLVLDVHFPSVCKFAPYLEHPLELKKSREVCCHIQKCRKLLEENPFASSENSFFFEAVEVQRLMLQIHAFWWLYFSDRLPVRCLKWVWLMFCSSCNSFCEVLVSDSS